MLRRFFENYDPISQPKADHTKLLLVNRELRRNYWFEVQSFVQTVENALKYNTGIKCTKKYIFCMSVENKFTRRNFRRSHHS